METPGSSLAAVIAATSLAACPSEEARRREDPPAPAAAPARAASPPVASAMANNATAPPGAAASGASGRSPLPTQAEWQSVREVTVKGSSALGCETKMVREWLRVSCRGKNDSGGAPTTVAIARGAGPDRYTFAGPGVTSLVLPFVEETDLEAAFSWTDKSHRLVVRWPRGSARPVIVGVFEGAASPLDAKACMECVSEDDERVAREQGKPCCANQSCRKPSDCEKGRQCCAAMDRAFCGQCDWANSVPICESDAQCPKELFGQPIACRPHQGTGLRACH